VRTYRLPVTLLGAVIAFGTFQMPVAESTAPNVDTVGVVDPGQGRWHLSNLDGDVTSFHYGNPGDVPFVGDWDCDGVDTPGLYRRSDGFVYLRNSNTTGGADVRFFFGNPNDVPLAGDFDKDGCDTVSVYRPTESRVFIINVLGSGGGALGPAAFDYFFGNPGDQPFTGDFDGDGIDTIGLHRESTGLVYFRNSHTQGFADSEFTYGNPGDRFVAGDWTADGIDTPALLRPVDRRIYFRYSNSFGVADRTMQFGGGAGLIPVGGVFGILTPGPDQVAGLKVTTGGGSGEIGVSWLPVTGATGYDVYWSLLPGDLKTVVGTVDETADQFGVPWSSATRLYVDGLGARFPRNLAGGLECYRVAARDALGREGPLSAERCLIPSVPLTPSVAPGAGSGELVFEWKAIAGGVDRYDVYWSLLPQADKQLVATLSESADQFGLPWSSPATRFFVDGVPPRSPRSTVPGLNCYVVVVSLASGQPPTGPASAEVCLP